MEYKDIGKAVDTDFIFIPIGSLEMNTGQIDGLPSNPRNITGEKMDALKKDIRQYPEMLKLRGLLVYPHNDKYVIIGGNMRYKAMHELGFTDAPCIVIPKSASVEQLKAYSILDNAPFGQWDWDMLANEWDELDLKDWGVDIPGMGSDGECANGNGNGYTKKIEVPAYEPKAEKPYLYELVSTAKCDELITHIESSKIPHEVKDFLVKAAYRHNVFNYEKIADFYAHSDKAVQVLMEESGLVIIDFAKAIDNGFVKVTDEMKDMYDIDHPDDE